MINKYNLRLCFSQHTSRQITEESCYNADSDSAGLGEITSSWAKLTLLLNKEPTSFRALPGPECSRKDKEVNQKQSPGRTEQNWRSLGWYVGKRENSLL